MSTDTELCTAHLIAELKATALAPVDADEIERLTREIAELKADRDSWIEQASQRAQETVEAMQQVDAYRMRCAALHSAPREPLTDEQLRAVGAEHYGTLMTEQEMRFARAIERTIASQPAAQHDAAMADAARFRWLDEVALSVDMVADPDNLVQVWHETLSGHATTGRTLREAVDEAMKRHNGPVEPAAQRSAQTGG